MKIPAIKKLVENYSPEQLYAAEHALMNEEPLPIEIEGDDEGEQLTHILAAIWVIGDMQLNTCDFRSSIRRYGEMVRNSIN
ncbi:MAG: hypothetical protein SFW35_01045 [Chitinophagales bacterium]|nr:hypothetical protein [Chitinophagales bacterium]